MSRWVLPALCWFGCATPTAAVTPAPQPAQPDEPEVELATLMLRFQVHTDKLWFSGDAKNWPLADFYLHELDETLEEVIDAKIVDDGHAVSDMASSQLRPALEAVEAAARLGGGFAEAYDGMVAACNTCHEKTDHGFVVLQRPTAPAYSNQDFTARP